MAGELALVGGREWTEGCTFDAGLIERSGTGEVLVLPTGSAYEDPAGLLERARTWFADLGAEVVDGGVLTRRDAYDDAAVARMRSARFIYLAGASPMHLRSVLKDSPAFEALMATWSEGATLVGSAAGADVLCDPMVDSRGGAFTVGLGLTRAMAVIPRVNTWSYDKVHRTVSLAPAGVCVVSLPEATALIHGADGTWRAEGVGEVVVHRDGAKVGLEALSPLS